MTFCIILGIVYFFVSPAFAGTSLVPLWQREIMKIDTKGRLSFRGGIHPPERKDLTQDSEIQPGPDIKEVAVMLSQHLGAVCRPVVRKGHMVLAEQKVGDSDAFVSAPVHSPIHGKVKEIALRSHPVLGRSPAVIIEAYRYSPKKTTFRIKEGLR